MPVATKWGVILGGAVVLWTLVIHFLGFYTSNIAAGQRADVVASILPIVTIFLALRERRNAMGSLPFRDALTTALVVGVVSVPITAAFLWWYHHYLNPRWLDLLVDYQRAKMSAAGAAAAEIAEAEARQRASGTDSAQLWGAFLGSIIVSAILGVVGWLVMRRRTAAKQ
jgi:hypothetical protein